MQSSIRTFAAADLPTLLHDWVCSQPVMGPKERRDQPGFYYFDWIESRDAELKRLARLLADGYGATTIPPKTAFFPTREPLFRFATDGHVVPEKKEQEKDFLLVGVHPCDLAALSLLDRAYGYPPADGRWRQRRRLATIVGIDCLPDDYCFCTSMGTSASRDGCDLFLTPIDGGFLAEVHSSKGQELLQGTHTEEAREKDLLAGEDFLGKKIAATGPRLQTGLEEFAEILEKTDLSDVWERTAQRCYSCGSCNTTCPTCFCFDMEDSLESNLTSGVRYRSWGSCQLLDFALIAGGTNTRDIRCQRVAHRWHRKFLYLQRQFDRPYCTGCGRCSRACTADINIVDVCNELIKLAKEKK